MTGSALTDATLALVERAFGPGGSRGSSGAGARLLESAPLAGDASSRSYRRLRLAGASSPTAVLMISPGSGLAISSDELTLPGEGASEMPFLNVQRWMAARGIAVPQVLATDEPRGLVLLEDIGDMTLWDAARTGDAEAVFTLAIDELVRLEAAGEHSPDPACIAFHQRFDERLFLWEFDHFLEYGFADRGTAKEDLAECRRWFQELSADLAGGEGTLTHRDYHAWNVFVQDGRVRVIDFQDALLAPVPYDLATLLNDRATPHVVGPALERRLAARFLAERERLLGAGDDLDRFLARYFLFVLQKACKVLGRFVYLEDVKGKTGYRAMLPDTLATLRRALAGLPRLVPLRKRLAKSFPELEA